MTRINPNVNLYKVQPSFKEASALPFMPNMDYSDPNMQFPVEYGQNLQYGDIPPVEIPDIYYTPPSKEEKGGIKETIKKVDMLDVVVPWFEHPLLMLGTCLGINYGIDAFSKSCNKEYEKSILGKAAKFGDKLEQSKFIQNETTQKGLGYIKSGWNKIKDFAMKSDIIKSMVETPSLPENSTPKNELLKTNSRILEQFGEVLRNTGLLSTGEVDGVAKFADVNAKSFHLTKDVIKQLEKDFGGRTMAEVGEEKFISRYLLKNSGFAESEITSVLNGSSPLKTALDKIRNMLGGSERLKDIVEGKLSNSSEEAVKICDKLKGIKLDKGSHIPFTNIKILSNETGFQEIFNRLHSLGQGASTKTGQFMSKLVQKIHRGFTFGGGKAGVMVFVAPHIVHTLVNTYKADKDEKVGTFMNGMISAVSWVFTFPLILKAIYALGGIQYAGMGKDKVNALKSKIEEFNQKVADGKFKNYKEWKDARKAVKKEISALRRVENQDFVTKCLRKVSQFLKSDLLKFDRYKNEGFLKRFLHNTPATVKNFIWSAGRFAVFMFVGMPILDKIITKCTNAIFGKTYDDMYEKENAEAKKQQKKFLKEDLQNRMYDAQAKKMGLLNQPDSKSQEQIMVQNPEQASSASLENGTVAVSDNANPFINETVQEELPLQEGIISEEPTVQQEEVQVYPQEAIQNSSMVVPAAKIKRDNYTYIPSQENIIQAPERAPINKYIPSQMPAKIAKTFDNSGLEAALKRADLAEAKAMQILSGKFPN